MKGYDLYGFGVCDSALGMAVRRDLRQGGPAAGVETRLGPQWTDVHVAAMLPPWTKMVHSGDAAALVPSGQMCAQPQSCRPERASVAQWPRQGCPRNRRGSATGLLGAAISPRCWQISDGLVLRLVGFQGSGNLAAANRPVASSSCHMGSGNLAAGNRRVRGPRQLSGGYKSMPHGLRQFGG